MERTRQGEFATVDLAAKDLDGQSAFYEQLFGWTHEDLPTSTGPYRLFSKDGGSVAGGYALSPDMEAAGMPSVWNTYIAVDDVDTMAEKAAGLGGQIVMPARNAEGYGRFVGIQDPTGGTVFLWHSNAPDASAIYDAPCTLAWNDLNTTDPPRAAEFFEQLLGWDVQVMQGSPVPYWLINLGGVSKGGIMRIPEEMPPDTPPNWLVYFAAEDARALADKAVALGGSQTIEPTKISGMMVAMLEDPAGALFAVLQNAAG